MESPTDYVIRFILDTDWQNVPIEVQHQSKRCLLDTLGAMLAGMETPVANILTRIGEQQYKGNEATILVSGKKCSASGAAFVNGFAGNALDIDDGYRLIKGHPGACVLPAVLAAGEMVSSCSGKQFLTALVVGYEIGIRSGLIRHARYETYHASGSWGALAGAAAAGKIMGLDSTTLRNALGTAEYHAPISPMMKGIAKPSMVKDGIGWGAMVAVMSVLMAQKGFTGIEPLFDDTPKAEWCDMLGDAYEILNLYFKPYAACRWAQPAIAGGLKIIKNHKISPEEITRIQVRTFTEATTLSCSPPKDTEQAQYNLSFPLAAALVDGEVGPKQVMPPRIYNNQILRLADKVDTEVSEAFDRVFPEKACAEVIIHTTSGASFSSGTIEARWEPPDDPPSDANLEEKFTWLVTPVLGIEQSRKLCALIWRLDEYDNVETLVDLCVKRR
jgi:2-methylcitrate dehydratase PrpD